MVDIFAAGSGKFGPMPSFKDDVKEDSACNKTRGTDRLGELVPVPFSGNDYQTFHNSRSFGR